MTAIATENQKPQHFSVEVTQYKEGNCTIGVEAYNTTANWVAMDNVRLYWLRGDVPAPVVDEQETYYIQNVETGRYLAAGNAWGTHTVLTEDGLPVRLTQLVDGSYTIYFLEGSRNQQLLFRADESGVYVDYNNNSNSCPYWTITATDEEGVFHIQSLVTDALYGQQVYSGTYLGNNPTKEAYNEGGNALGVYNDVDGNILDKEGMNIKWRFISEGAYNVKELKDDLRKLIGYAEVVGTDITEAQAVVYDYNADSDAVSTAVTNLRTAYIEQLHRVSKESLPLDVSGVIVNADFDHNDSQGWTNSETEGLGEKSVRADFQAYEFWNTAFDFHQTITGLPNGNYVLKMKGFHRIENWEGTTLKSQYGEPTAMLYANDESKTLRSILDGMTESNYADDWTVDDDGTTYYVPKSMWGVATRFARDMYWNEVPVTVTDGELTIGVKLDNYTSSCWVMFDEFRLELLDLATTDNSMSAASVTMLAGQKSKLSVELNNADEIVMAEFYVQLPEGMSIAEDKDGNPDCTFNSNRLDGHAPEVNQTSERRYHFVIYSSSNKPLKGNEGELVSMKIVCAEGVTPGDYTGTIRNILLRDNDNNSIRPANADFTITVADATLGDVNGDRSINGLDIVELVDHIMGRESQSFVQLTSDLNNDGKINGIDLVKLVRLVLEQDVPEEDETSNAKALSPMLTGMLTLENDGECLKLGVEQSRAFILSQCVLELSDGMELLDVETDTGHTATWLQTGEGRYSILAYSTKNATFTDNGSLLRLRFSGEGSVSVSNVLAVDAKHNGWRMSGVNTDVVTDIDDIGIQTASDDSYDLQGRKVYIPTDRSMKKGIYIINGKKVLVK